MLQPQCPSRCPLTRREVLGVHVPKRAHPARHRRAPLRPRDPHVGDASAHILGRGGFGPVYRGEWQGRAVAVKRLDADSLQAGMGRRRTA